VNEIFPQEAAAQGVEVQVASVRAQALDATGERCPRPKVHQRAEPARGADIARGKYVEATETAQQDQAGAPGAEDGASVAGGSHNLAVAFTFEEGQRP